MQQSFHGHRAGPVRPNDVYRHRVAIGGKGRSGKVVPNRQSADMVGRFRFGNDYKAAKRRDHCQFTAGKAVSLIAVDADVDGPLFVKQNLAFAREARIGLPGGRINDDKGRLAVSFYRSGWYISGTYYLHIDRR